MNDYIEKNVKAFFFYYERFLWEDFSVSLVERSFSVMLIFWSREKKNKLSVALSENVLVGFFLFWIKHTHEFGFFMF